MKKSIKSFIYLLAPIPLILGFIGYYLMDGGAAGDDLNFFEALYASAALYFVNPVADNRNWVITVAQIMALLVTTSVILTFISSIAVFIGHMLDRMHSDSTTVYSNTEFGQKLAVSLRHGYLCGSMNPTRIEKTNDHIILFQSDDDNVSFYQKYKEDFKKEGRRVFIGLQHVDSSLLNMADDNVHFFCLDEIVARDFWKKYNLYDDVIQSTSGSSSKPVKIGIVGFGYMGQALMKQAFLTNIFSSEQIIEYHIWGSGPLDALFLNNLNTANSDKIIVHDEASGDISDALKMNRIIITSEDSYHKAQVLLRLDYRNPVYCYCESGTDFSPIFSSLNVRFFGDVSSLLTEEKIKEEQLFAMARLTNFSYNLMYSEHPDVLPDDYQKIADELWNRLDGFTKGSNVARADYWWIEKRRAEAGIPDDERWKTEHIRWCRYHYYNGWKFAQGEKNVTEKTHPDLIAYEKLSADEKRKDGTSNAKLKKIIEEKIVEEMLAEESK